jgi:metal transporter CNNM
MLCVQRIIPQAVSVRYGLSIGAACAPLVLGMMYLFGTVHVFIPTIREPCY